ncbi:MAG: hypothetical protein K0R18_97 [Bacillales bacterium]|jgi:hypothetical protein|nr:hypothetical protein [Bacillales bacterium]
MIRFTQTRYDMDPLSFGARMLRAGVDGYKSISYDIEWDNYVLLSTATPKEIETYTEKEMLSIFEELETLGEKESKEFILSSGEVVELYWEIDCFSK